MDRVYQALVFVCILSLPKAGGVGPTACRVGWTYHNSACWRAVWVGYEALTRSVSQLHCEVMGTHLASIHSHEEQNFVANTLITDPPANCHFVIGLSRPTVGDPLQWTDGTPVDYTYWDTDNDEPWADGLLGYIKPTDNYTWELANNIEFKNVGYICRVNQGEQDWSPPFRAVYEGFVPAEGYLRTALAARLALVKYERDFRGGLARCAMLCAAMPGCRGINFGAEGTGHLNPRCHLMSVNILDDGRPKSRIMDPPQQSPLRHYYPID